MCVCRPNRPIDWLNTRNWSVVGLQSGSGSPAALRHGFRWLNTDTTISVDLSMNDSSVAAFLELLYYTSVCPLFFCSLSSSTVDHECTTVIS